MKTDISNMNDNGDIKGLDAREDGVYITYFNGADTVTKKLGSGGEFILKDSRAGIRNYTYKNDTESEKKVLAVAFWWTDWGFTETVTNGKIIANLDANGPTHGISTFSADLLPGESFTFGIQDGPSVKVSGCLIFEYE